jgi:DNA-binding Lrp family transcriptional regulator
MASSVLAIVDPRDDDVLSPLDRQLLDRYQRGFPLSPRPFAAVAAELGSDEEAVIAAFRRLAATGCISRIGAIVAPHEAGWSTLAAMAVPADRLNETAALVSAYPEVNHNYEREHRWNLWFVVTAASATEVARVLRDINARTGLTVLDLPMTRSFRLDLGFPLQWD